jgi:hypothetical protein
MDEAEFEQGLIFRIRKKKRVEKFSGKMSTKHHRCECRDGHLCRWHRDTALRTKLNAAKLAAELGIID